MYDCVAAARDNTELNRGVPRPAWAAAGSVAVVIDPNTSALERLAQLLRFRFGASRRRSFVMLAVDVGWAQLGNTDDQETQRIPVMDAP